MDTEKSKTPVVGVADALTSGMLHPGTASLSGLHGVNPLMHHGSHLGYSPGFGYRSGGMYNPLMGSAYSPYGQYGMHGGYL